jgi:ABC-type phosphate transport system auxiliary subunit
LEDELASKEAGLGEMMRRFARGTMPVLRDMAETEMRSLAVEIEALRNELQRLQRDALADDRSSFSDRVEAALARLNADDPTDARAALNRELRRRVKIVLYRDRSIVARFAASQTLSRAEIVFRPAGIEAFRIIAQDGTILTEFTGAGLELLAPITEEQIEAAA